MKRGIALCGTQNYSAHSLSYVSLIPKLHGNLFRRFDPVFGADPIGIDAGRIGVEVSLRNGRAQTELIVCEQAANVRLFVDRNERQRRKRSLQQRKIGDHPASAPGDDAPPDAPRVSKLAEQAIGKEGVQVP